MRSLLSTILELAGTGGFVYGLYRWHITLAVIVGSVLVAAAGFALSTPPRQPPAEL